MRNFETFASGLVFLAFTIFLVNEVDGIIQKMALVLWGICITIGAILLWKLENSMDSKKKKGWSDAHCSSLSLLFAKGFYMRQPVLHISKDCPFPPLFS